MANSRATSKAKDILAPLKGDYGNIAFLLLLYILQGIPIGLSTSVPLLLQNRKVSYSEQAIFSFVTWPFSIKLLWAPIVDSVFWSKIGRRKSWLVPAQLCIGAFMLILSGHIENMMKDDPTTGQTPNVLLLTGVFLVLNFLAATQDIAVDGWALTMLSRRNVGYSSTCNTVGQTAGYFLGNVIFLALESADFSNRYLRSASNQQSTGVVTFESFLYYCGIVFLIITTLVAFLKSEKRSQTYKNRREDEELETTVRLTRRKNSDISKSPSTASRLSEDSDTELCTSAEDNLTVKGTYLLLYKIMKLPSFKLFAVILLTCKIGFSAPDAVSGLKLIESGVHKESIAMLAVPMLPLQMVLPWILSRMTCGPKPLSLLIKSYPYRLLFGLVFPLVVYWTPSMKLSDGSFPAHYYVVLLIIYGLHQVTVYSIFVSLMAFHAAVSDPSIGGTYMTLLNTISNLGANWPSTLSLWLVDRLTVTSCSKVCKEVLLPTNATLSTLNNTTGHESKLVCKDKCTTLVDGYYIECIFCVVIGFLWLLWGGERLRRLQSLPQSAWSVAANKAH